MKEELLYILCILVFLIGTIFLYFNAQQTKEGFQSVATNGIGIGEASNSANHATALKNQLELLKDSMNIAKYRKDYEDTIIHLDDILGYEMLKTTVNFNTNDDLDKQVKDIENINKLNDARNNLNNLMKWVDKQK